MTGFELLWIETKPARSTTYEQIDTEDRRLCGSRDAVMNL